MDLFTVICCSITIVTTLRVDTLFPLRPVIYDTGYLLHFTLSRTVPSQYITVPHYLPTLVRYLPVFVIIVTYVTGTHWCTFPGPLRTGYITDRAVVTHCYPYTVVYDYSCYHTDPLYMPHDYIATLCWIPIHTGPCYLFSFYDYRCYYGILDPGLPSVDLLTPVDPIVDLTSVLLPLLHYC